MNVNDDELSWYLNSPEAGPSTSAGSPVSSKSPSPPLELASEGVINAQSEVAKGKRKADDKETKGTRVKSCAPCRIRRVACQRGPDPEAPCLKCQSKGISCTAVPPREKKVLNRTGKRIKLTQALFGDSEGKPVVAEEGSAIPVGSTSAFQTAKDILGTEFSQALSPVSTAGRLASTEVQGSLISSLLDFYLSYTKNHPSLLESTAFRESFDRAGRRMAQMSDQDQVLCSVVMALAARTSNHPLLVGVGAPPVAQLTGLVMNDQSLAEYGSRRESACRDLTKRAVEVADRTGTMRTASVESIASLLLLEGLVEASEDEGLSTSATPKPPTQHPYASAVNSHAKILLEMDLPRGMRQRLSGTLLGYTIYIREVMSASNLGRVPSFSDDDVLLLRGEDEEPLPLLSELLAVPDPNPHVACWRLFSSLLAHIAESAQITSQRLTGLKARRSLYIDEEFAHAYIGRMEISLAALPTLKQRVERVLRTGEYLHTPQFEAHGKDVIGSVRSLRCAVAGQSMLLARVVAQRMAGRKGAPAAKFIRWPPLPGPLNDDAYWVRLKALEDKARSLAFVAARSIVSVVEEAFSTGDQVGSSEWLDARGTMMLFSNVSMSWQNLLINTPTSEEGGPPGFDFTTKLAELRWLLRGLNSVGWAYEKLSRPASRVQTEIQQLENKRAAHWSNDPSPHFTFTSIAEPAAELELPMFSEEDLQALLALPTDNQYLPIPGSENWTLQ
ncbi:hypothetical protein T439DRAFT_329714 [Meredithblackwellia eburnea MCA 4105]